MADAPDAPTGLAPRPPCQTATPTHLFTQPLGQTHRLNNNDYYTGEQYKTALNSLLGVENWSFRILEHGYDEPADEFWVLGELTAVIWEHDPNDEGYVRCVVVKQQFGGQNAKRRRSDNKLLSAADDRKAAATDALKKCATDLGFGLHLSAKNPQGDLPYRRGENDPWQAGEFVPVTPGQKVAGYANASSPTSAPQRPQQPPAGANGTSSRPARPAALAPADESDRPALLARYVALVQQAIEADLDWAWLQQDPTKLTSPQLLNYGNSIERSSQFQAARSAGAA